MSYSVIGNGLELVESNNSLEINSDYLDLISYFEKKYDILISCKLYYVSDRLTFRLSLNFPTITWDFGDGTKPYGLMLIDENVLPSERLEKTIVSWIQKENPVHLRTIKLNSLFND